MAEKDPKKKQTEEWRYRQSRRQDLVHIFIFLLLLVVFHVLLVQVRIAGKREVEETEKRYAVQCCADKNPPQAAITTGFGCRNCPSGSEPRLVGYYCESCPAGYEPRKKEDFEFAKGVFGCKPCKPKFFKASVGNSQCQPCPTTGKDQTGATQCLT